MGQVELSHNKTHQKKTQSEILDISLREDKETKTPRKYFFIIGIFSFGFNFITTTEYVHFRPIMADVGFTSATQVSILLVSSLVSLCIGAAIGGVFNDGLRTSFGQRAPAIFTGSAITVGLFLIIPLITTLIDNLQVVYGLLVVILIISHIALGCAFSPWLALLPELFQKKEQFNASIAINIFSAMGAAIAVLLFSYLIDKNLSWLIWIVTAVIFGVSALITSLLIPKTNTLEKSNVKVTDIWKIPQTIWRLGGKNWILLLIVGCFWGFSSHLVETSIVDSLVKRFNIMDTKASLTTNILMGGYIILFLLPLIWSTNKIKYKWTSIITSGIYCLFCILLAILPKFNWIYFIVLFGGIGNILLSTLQIALPANRVPKGKEASFLGIFFVFGTILKPVATLIQGLILENKEANTNVGIFGGYPWVFLIAGLIMLLTIIPLSLIQDKKNDIKNNKEKSVTL